MAVFRPADRARHHRRPFAPHRARRRGASRTPAPRSQPGVRLLGRPGRLAVPVRSRRSGEVPARRTARRAAQPAGRGPDRRPAQRHASVSPAARRADPRPQPGRRQCARERCPRGRVFDRRAVTTTWHYQWIVVHDFLPRLVGPELVEEILAEGPRGSSRAPRRTSRWSSPTRPIATATARSGTPTASSTAVEPRRSSPTCSGFRPHRPGPPHRLAQMFDVPGRPPAQRAKRIDGRLPPASSELPERSPARSTRGLPLAGGPRPAARGRPPGCPAARRSPGSSAWAPLDRRRAGEATWPPGLRCGSTS